MTNVTEDWSVRDFINHQLEDNVIDIAKYVLEHEVDYEEDAEGLFDCISNFIDVEQCTLDEIEHIMFNTQIHCGIQELEREGLVSFKDGLVSLI